MQQVPAERRLRRHVPSLPAIKPDRLKSAKALVEKAVKLRKVFSVHGPYPVIRAALWSRGWVERRSPHPEHRAAHCHRDDGEEEEDGDATADVLEQVDEQEKEENADDMYDLMSRLVRNETTYFHWTTRRDDVDCRSLRSDQMTNHYANAGTLTTKVGLCVNLRNLQWFDTTDPDSFFPRCYRLGAEDDKHAFIDDFRRTACTSLLQHVVEASGSEAEDRNASNSVCGEAHHAKHRSVGSEAIATALTACQEFLGVLEHSDIDVAVETPPSVKEQQWAAFLRDYYMVAHEGAWIRGAGPFVERCRVMLTRLREVCPQLDTDGLSNIWIVKPGAKSRGRGILCMNRLDEILALSESDRALNSDSRWVVQKYLERPLLVHDTKFDLRQWFLVTDWNPLTVWFYGECYLRFSTQPYSTRTLDSAVHLCNNSIQKHLQPSRDRHPAVPADNMWSGAQFRAFLRRQGREARWESAVVPGMRRAVVCALQTVQDLVEPRKASFELYGADFMLGRDLRPWLLEVNASPTMACSSAATARLCPAVQRDTLRVVLDRRADPSAYTGGFHLIYRQAAVDVPPYVGVNLLVEGVHVRRCRPALRRHSVASRAQIGFPSEQSTSEEAETVQRPPGQPGQSGQPGQKPPALAALRHSGKENREAGENKRQLASLSPKRDGARGAGRGPAPDQPLALQAEPRSKARRLTPTLGANGATLIPQSLCFSLSPLKSVPDAGRARSKPGRPSHMSRPLPPHEHQPRASTRDLPSLAGPLPALEVFRLRPLPVVARRSPLAPASTGTSCSVLTNRARPNAEETSRADTDTRSRSSVAFH